MVTQLSLGLSCFRGARKERSCESEGGGLEMWVSGAGAPHGPPAEEASSQEAVMTLGLPCRQGKLPGKGQGSRDQGAGRSEEADGAPAVVESAHFTSQPKTSRRTLRPDGDGRWGPALARVQSSHLGTCAAFRSLVHELCEAEAKPSQPCSGLCPERGRDRGLGWCWLGAEVREAPAGPLPRCRFP